MIIFLLLVIYFIACQILTQKGIIPKFLKDISASKLMFRSLLIILLTAAISTFIHQAVFLVALSTVYLSIVISNYYLKAFQKMERGKKI